MLSLKAVLLTVAAALAIRYGPFSDRDSGAPLATGLVLVSVMGIQNAAQRLHFSRITTRHAHDRHDHEWSMLQI